MSLTTQTADRFRQRKNHHGGIVMFNGGAATAWLPEMPAPEDWQCGVTAVDVDGNQWIAWGGDEFGAQSWRKLN